MTEPSRPARLHSLTGLRFFAAVIVFLHHVTISFPFPFAPFADRGLASGLGRGLEKAGWLGVSFFFVLSGFVLAWSAARGGDTAVGFWRRRLVRVFPSHAVTWALAMLLFAGAATPLWSSLPNLLLLQPWSADPRVHFGVNSPSWSLGAEVFFYLLFPLLIGLVRRIGPGALRGWALAMGGGVIAVQLVAQFVLTTGAAPYDAPVTGWQFWFGYAFPPARLFEFTLGLLLARLLREGLLPRVGVPSAALGLAAGYALATAVPWLNALTALMIVPVAALICAVAARDVEGVPTVLRGRTLRRLGEVSFGFYLVHYVVIHWVRVELMDGRLLGTAAGAALICGLFVASLAAGALLMVAVERPAVRRWSRPRRALPEAKPPQHPQPQEHPESPRQPEGRLA
ncbi:acyltransferase family protein [Streptomyces sp. NPDC055060]